MHSTTVEDILSNQRLRTTPGRDRLLRSVLNGYAAQVLVAVDDTCNESIIMQNDT